MQTTTFYAIGPMCFVLIENRLLAPSSCSLLVFLVHAYRLDINCADEIQKFGCHVVMVRKNKVIFFKAFFIEALGSNQL